MGLPTKNMLGIYRVLARPMVRPPALREGNSCSLKRLSPFRFIYCGTPFFSVVLQSEKPPFETTRPRGKAVLYRRLYRMVHHSRPTRPMGRRLGVSWVPANSGTSSSVYKV